MNKILFAILICTVFAGCQKEYIKVPYYQPIVVSDPPTPNPLVLKNPEIKAMSTSDIIADASKPENANKIYYVLTPEALADLLNDDVDKLEYTKYETYRANFYKNAIQEFNKNVEKLNSQSDKKYK